MSALSPPAQAVSRYPELMMLQFSDLKYDSSLEIAGNFMVDFTLDNEVTGLEIDWDDKDREGCEPAIVAFGLVGTALYWLAYNYNEQAKNKPHEVIQRKVNDFIASIGLPLQVIVTGPRSELSIVDETGNLLLAVDILSGNSPIRSVFERRYSFGIDWLKVGKLQDAPDAIGIAVYIDNTGTLQQKPAIAPGGWMEWGPLAGCPIWAHVAIIPPKDNKYSWLPTSFIPLPDHAI